MNLLILGGTQFVGRYLVQSALARNHQVTLFNRGHTNPGLFPEVEKLRGDRNGNLQSLKGRAWDAVIDTCGFVSENVRASATLLADATAHYTFISSISVYADYSNIGLDESTTPLCQLPERVVEFEGDQKTYGARKVLCERAAEAAMPGRVLTVRPGLIVGPHDPLGRFPYWVRRVAAGGEVLVPAPPEAPLQLIDVRDLAEWIIKLAEARATGIFNATGPKSTLTFQGMLEQCAAAAGSKPQFTWASAQFLREHKVTPFSDLPLWLPKTARGFFAINCQRAFAAGLVCRPLFDTARDTLDWDRANGAPPKVGLTSEREQELLQAWKRQTVES